jgi:hypothetical protein
MRAKSKRRGHGTPTPYAGVTFRSSLESQWARRFDLLGVAWNYEPVRIRLTRTGDNYTPDFGLPAFRAVVEVKPREPYEVEFDRAAEAATVLGGGVYFLCGTPRAANYWASRNMGEGWYFVPVTVDGLPFPTELPGRVAGDCGRESPTPVRSGEMSGFVLTAKKSSGGGDYEKPPPGNHPAVLVAVIDMGHQWQEPFKGDPKSKGAWQHRAFFVWELVTKKQSGSTRNHVIGLDLTLSLNEKAKLRKWVEARMGRPIAEGENYDAAKELGLPCLLNVVEKNGYPKIEGVSAVPEGFTVPAPQNKPLAWNITTAMDAKRIDLPTWLPYHYGQPIGDVIKKAQELDGMAVEVVNSPNSAPPPADSNTPAPAATAGNPPPRRPRDSAPPADPEFFVDADGYDDKRPYKVSELRASIEGKTGVDMGNIFVTRNGAPVDWQPLANAVPEAKNWLPF